MPHVRINIDLSSVPFWQKHFSNSSVVNWNQFVECLILEHVGESFDLTRRQANKLAPYFDQNGDAVVTREEFAGFVRMYGGNDDKSPKMLRKALRESLGLVRQLNRGGGKEASPERETFGGMDKLTGSGGTTFGGMDKLTGRETFGGMDKLTGSGDAGQPSGGGCGISLTRSEAQYIELENSGNLQFAGMSPFTIEMWIMPRSVDKSPALISKYNRGKWGQYMVKLETGA
ncbi:hypothetical protein CYMTET_21697 [Cymbomonas tetramitiformis]|uniref:EF-hand domain-containing protein n=1 Tax=Cymbomonas tetramitiformis TaxID=36881 RepID=A0AAE0G2B6_9CHLO|nr:hypothetical protein CYMTET_21697 [Cymbomonas tetramitiformis]